MNRMNLLLIFRRMLVVLRLLKNDYLNYYCCNFSGKNIIAMVSKMNSLKLHTYTSYSPLGSLKLPHFPYCIYINAPSIFFFDTPL